MSGVAAFRYLSALCGAFCIGAALSDALNGWEHSGFTRTSWHWGIGCQVALGIFLALLAVMPKARP